jgi:hypothetical protein
VRAWWERELPELPIFEGEIYRDTPCIMIVPEPYEPVISLAISNNMALWECLRHAAQVRAEAPGRTTG